MRRRGSAGRRGATGPARRPGGEREARREEAVLRGDGETRRLCEEKAEGRACLRGAARGARDESLGEGGGLGRDEEEGESAERETCRNAQGYSRRPRARPGRRRALH